MENINITPIIVLIITIIFMFLNSWWNRKMLKKHSKKNITENKSRNNLYWIITNGFLILMVLLLITKFSFDLIKEPLSKYLIFSVSFNLISIFFIINILFDRFKTRIYIEMFESLAKGIDKNEKSIREK